MRMGLGLMLTMAVVLGGAVGATRRLAIRSVNETDHSSPSPSSPQLPILMLPRKVVMLLLHRGKRTMLLSLDCDHFGQIQDVTVIVVVVVGRRV